MDCSLTEKICFRSSKDTGYLGSKPAVTPMDSKLRLTATSEELLADGSEYRRLIGRLVYLTITRPDLSFVIQNLSQCMSAPRTDHLSAAHRVLRYIKGTPGLGVLLPSKCNFQLKAYLVTVTGHLALIQGVSLGMPFI